jgi:hypothetical protein
MENYFLLSGHEHAPVLFSNSGTILPAGSLAALLEKVYAIPETGVVAPQLVHHDGRIQPSFCNEIRIFSHTCFSE